jgi:hypothetical protein
LKHFRFPVCLKNIRSLEFSLTPLHQKRDEHNNVSHKANLSLSILRQKTTAFHFTEINDYLRAFQIVSFNQTSFLHSVINWIWCHYERWSIPKANEHIPKAWIDIAWWTLNIFFHPKSRARESRALREQNLFLKLNHCEFIIHLINCYWVIIVKRIVDFSCLTLGLHFDFSSSLCTCAEVRFSFFHRISYSQRERLSEIKYPLCSK